ncbi:MAG: tRNA 2-selenouridine(34) synthase MnmH [Candidatus Woesearchaeota archaeon]
MINFDDLKKSKIEYLDVKNIISVEDFEKERLKGNLIIFDARSPLEFEEFHVVGSINLPLLKDEARKIVGTAYKEFGEQKAVDKGWELFKNTFEELISKAKKEISKNKDKKIVVYCARGGMRSRIVSNLLEFLGYEVYQIEGGIKEYRNSLYLWLDDLLTTWKGKFIVLEGMTGTRKTELIKILDIPKIDLEDLANHRASTYGGVGLIERNQKMFLFLLYEELLKLKKCNKIVIEGESKKIGKIHLPEKLFSLMMNGDFVHVVASEDVRIQHIVDEYCCSKEKIDELIELTPRLVKLIGKKKVDEVINWFETGNYYSAVRYLLLEYYDKVYKNFAKKYVFEICTDDLLKAKKELEEFID